MLYLLILDLIDSYSFLNVFKYLTVRTGLSIFTAMVVVFLVGNPLINFFSSKQIHNPIREDGPSDHIIRKIGTPTMGGLLMFNGTHFELIRKENGLSDNIINSVFILSVWYCFSME